MIVDASALIAILLGEADAHEFAGALRAHHPKLMAAPTYLEVCMVMIGRKGQEAKSRVERLIAETRIAVVPFDGAVAQIAVDAFQKYGKGRHRAGLNFGDCMSYALAKAEVMPLLFKGDDFRLTDIEPAL